MFTSTINLFAVIFTLAAVIPTTIATRIQVRSISPKISYAMFDGPITVDNRFQDLWFDLNPDRTVKDGRFTINIKTVDLGPPSSGAPTGLIKHCQIKGSVDPSQTTDFAFLFSSGLSFHHPCGNHHGLEMFCDPESTCSNDLDLKEFNTEVHDGKMND